MKKYLLFIVEGKNDKKELQAILRAACGAAFTNRFVDSYHVHGGDITTEHDTTEKTIIGKLNKIVVSWRNGGEDPFQKIPTSDVARIIHVIDTDGVFIPESSILQTDDAKVVYEDNAILFFARDQIVGRNRKKSSVIRRLLEVKKIDNIPYEVFFASCNMDHLLFADRNPIVIDKGRNAFIFAGKCTNKECLQDSIYAPQIRAEGSLEDSWCMIQEGFHSLARHTNLNILMDSIDLRE